VLDVCFCLLVDEQSSRGALTETTLTRLRVIGRASGRVQKRTSTSPRRRRTR